MTTDTAALVYDARVTIGRIRQAWPWLTAMVEPGPYRWTPRPLSEAERARLNAVVKAERAEGVSRALTSPAPLRVGVLAALEQAAALVDDAARTTARALNATYVGARNVDAALDWITVAVLDVRNQHAAAAIVRPLGRADVLLRQAADCGDEVRVPVHAPCPACGRRSLQAEVGSPRRLEWSIRCGRAACRCSGPGCGCGRPVRYDGRPHVWPYGEWQWLDDALPRHRMRRSAA